MTGPVTLVTDRLILRDFTEGDWQATLAYQSDPRYLGFYPWTQRTEPEVRDFVNLFVSQQQEQPRRNFQLALTQKSDGRLIGSGGVRVHNAKEQQANLGYELDPRFWGNGFATEAVRVLLRFGFQTLGMHRIHGECIAENTASVRVMEKNGMRQEAHFRDNAAFKDRWWDSLIYALLEEEWRSEYAGIP